MRGLKDVSSLNVSTFRIMAASVLSRKRLLCTRGNVDLEV